MGSSATDNFCLRWNDFAENVSGAFKDLRAESDFFDVTLACTDSGSRTLQAHKVILSACSSFFKTMLRQQMSAHKHPNPYIYLRGVSYNDLASVLDFIYNGEVNVAQEDLNSFLAVAEELQIKGLTNRDGTSAAGEAGSSAQRSARAKARDSAGPPAKKFKRASPLPSSSGAGGASAAAVASAVVADEDDVKEISIKDDPEAVAAGSSAVNPDGADVSGTDFGEEGYDESYDGYYEGDDTGEMGDAAEGDASGDGTKGQSGSENTINECMAQIFQRLSKIENHNLQLEGLLGNVLEVQSQETSEAASERVIRSKAVLDCLPYDVIDNVARQFFSDEAFCQAVTVHLTSMWKDIPDHKLNSVYPINVLKLCWSERVLAHTFWGKSNMANRSQWDKLPLPEEFHRFWNLYVIPVVAGRLTFNLAAVNSARDRFFQNHRQRYYVEQVYKKEGGINNDREANVKVYSHKRKFCEDHNLTPISFDAYLMEIKNNRMNRDKAMMAKLAMKESGGKTSQEIGNDCLKVDKQKKQIKRKTE